MLILELLILLVIVLGLIFIRLPSLVWVPLIAIVLLFVTFYFQFAVWLDILLWIIFILLAAFSNIRLIRIGLFSLPCLRWFRKNLPSISSTEREALEAGDVWWEAELFSGRPDWNKLHAIPEPTLTQEERDFVDRETETLCTMLDDWKIVQEDCDLTKEAWNYLRQKGFFALAIDKKYGGKGFSAFAQSTIVSKIAARSMSAAVNTMVPNSLGPGELLQHYGTDEQKQYYLPRLASGEEIPCFALTSTDAGSDAGAMQDKGIICKDEYQGQQIIGIKLTWDKRYITLAPIATVLGLAFKLYDPDHLLSEKESIGITVCLLPTSYPGVNVGERHYPMNSAFLNGPTSGEDVFIPLDWVIGGQKMLGKGWRMLMECLSIGRSISLPALSAAAANLSYCTTGMYAYLRKQFKVSVGQFEGVQEAMARIAGNAYLLEASRIMTSGAVGLNIKPSVVSAIQKYHATELARITVDAAIDVHAGKAVQLGPRNYIGQLYFIIPMTITVEGANILVRNLIIFGQGAIRCHPYILEEMNAVNDPDKKQAINKFDQALKSHVGYMMSNIIRSFAFGLSKARFVKAANKHRQFNHYYRQLTRMSSALALTSDFAMLSLGGQLKRKERLSARLGDVLSYLYLATTVLKYHVDAGYPEEDVAYVKWCLETSLLKIQTAFYGFFDNFPAKGMARVLRFLIFPYGRSYKGPSDQLEAKIVQIMMQPSSLRDRLTKNIYIPDDKEDPIGRLNIAFLQAHATIEIEKRIHSAIMEHKILPYQDNQSQVDAAVQANIITSSEAEKLLAAKESLQQVMQADSFSADYLRSRGRD